ncbi:MAG: DUF58 domain-containing protein [Planctomycetota bacterium]
MTWDQPTADRQLPRSGLTHPAFLQRLESLVLFCRRVLAGNLQSRRASSRRGAGIVYADHADYHPGDDIRAVDWRILGKRDELSVRLFEREEEATLHLLLDCSRSMHSKRLLSLQLAAALGYIALAGYDRVALYGLGAKLRPLQTPMHGRGRALSLLRLLESCPLADADSDLEQSLRGFLAKRPRRGVCVLISDGLFPGGFDRGLELLRASKQQATFLQVQDPADLRCDWRGDVDLCCVETGQRRQLTIGQAEADSYQALIEDWDRRLATSCLRNAVNLRRCSIADPFDQVVRELIMAGGLVA